MSKTVRVLCSMAAIASIAGCSTSYKVEKVEDFTQPEKLNGIFYYLPKTKVNVEAVATVTSDKKYGKFYSGSETIVGMNNTGKTTYKEVFDQNIRNCTGGKTPIILAEDNLKPTSSSQGKISDFVVATQSVADPEHLYRLDIDPGALASFSHSISIDANGIITGAESTVSDAVTPFVFNLVDSGLSLAAAAAGFAAAADGNEYCKEFNHARAGTTPFDAERTALFAKDWSDTDPAIFDAILKETDAKIARYKSAQKKNLTTSEKKKNYVVVWQIDPVAGRLTYDSTMTSPIVYEHKKKPADDANERLSYIPGTALTTLERVTTPAALSSSISAVQFRFTPDFATTPEQSAGTSGHKGYRHRIPVSSGFEILNNANPVAKTSVMVAQFGAIATLPSKFNGSKAVLTLAFDSNSGAFTKATVSADPLSSNAVSQYVSAAADFTTKKNAADQEKAKAAEEAATAAARADIDAALLEIERLKAEKELKELRESLGLSSE